ncbi:MAG TPA: hypothetical protein VF614_15520 [Chthoniobacteraceae bacterium]
METTSDADETSPATPLDPPVENLGEAPQLADGAAEIAPEVAAEVAREAAAEAPQPEEVAPFTTLDTGADEPSASDAELPNVQPSETASAESAAPASFQEGEGETGAHPPGEMDELDQLVARAQNGRLSAPDEDRAKTLLKQELLGGKAGVARAALLLPRFVWVVGVDAVTGAWGEMKVTSKTQLLKALGDEDSDAVRRMRLSLSRGLFKIDVPAALKVAIGVVKELKDKETGLLGGRQAQIFSNVFIGKARPWVAQLPLAELKPAEAEALVHCAVVSAFSLPHPPVTQLGVLKWAGEGGRLTKLHESALAAVVKAVSRWSGKWQGALRNEVAELPEAIAAALKPITAEPAPVDAPSPAPGDQPRGERVDPAPADRDEEDFDDEDDDQESTDAPPPRKERPVYEPRPQKPVAADSGDSAREPRDSRERDRERNDRGERGDRERGDRDQRKERPVYQPRNAGSGSAGGAAQGFNLNETLRQIEAHVQSLRNELNTAQTKLRQREDDRGRGGGGASGRRGAPERPTPIVHGEPTIEELARLNQQLEARAVELQTRIDELAADSEDRAVSMGVMSGEPVADPGDQLRTLLGLKLQEDYADYLALEAEAPDFVVQQHYKALLKDVFAVLRHEGIPLKEE